MKKVLSVLFTVAIIATMCCAMFVNANAAKTVEVKRLTLTATNLKLEDDNMSQADAITACTNAMGSEVATRAIYSKTQDGKYNYLSCFMNTGWIAGGTGTLDEIIADAGIYGVMFVGTFDDECQPIDEEFQVKAAGAEASAFDFKDAPLRICTEEELAYVQNEVNKTYAGQGNVVCIQLYYNKERQKNMVMQFVKDEADKDCVASGMVDECNSFADYLEQNSKYTKEEAKYIVYDILSPKMLDGANQEVDLTKSDVATFRCESDFASFVGFMLDNKFVDPSNYTAKAGSTIVEVKKSYLNTLTNGKHLVSIVSKEGVSTTEFTLSGADGTAKADTTEKKTAPNTGDSTYALLFAMLSVVSAFGVAVVVKNSKKAER